MRNIILLNDETINKIAAGEVVDRPSSIVKELIENSIDASSSAITIEIKNGGKNYICVSDNGIGISSSDISLVFARHATSKITKADDIFSLSTMGFRGEAMASIASVADVELFTNTSDGNSGNYYHVKGGSVQESKEIGFPVGTTIKVRNLFFNAPARLKFLKSDVSEQGHIVDLVEKLSLINHMISFKLIVDEKTVFHTPGNGDMLSTIHCIYGKNRSKLMIPIKYENNVIKINGYIGKPELTKGNGTDIIFSVNDRLIKNKTLVEAARQAYKSLIMVNRYPICICNIFLNTERFDVNVHPSKAEIKFEDDRAIFSTVYTAIRSCLSISDSTHEFDQKDTYVNQSSEDIKKKENEFKFEKISENKNENFFLNQNFASSFSEYPNLNRSNKVNEEIINIKEDMSYVAVDDNDKMIPELNVIGQLFNTYILAQTQNEFYMIDQHAAHERIMYEFMLKKYNDQDVQIQELLLPIIIDLSPKDYNKYIDNVTIFYNLGFNVESFGENTIRISSVPIIMGEPCSGSIFYDILDHITDSNNNVEGNKNKIILNLACKNAIKAGDFLNLEECKELLYRLKQTCAPYNCPHGRPTILKMSQLELEKKFKRVL